MPKPPIITLLTDFGLADHYVAAMKGVILRICPETQLVDISHEVRAYGIEEASFVLGQSYQYFPDGTVHVVVVDPGVGSSRRTLVLGAGGHRFVGPDNGVLSWPMDRDSGFEAREITAERYFRTPVSRTFHGRDIFAPVAAHIAAGTSLADTGPLVANPVRLKTLVNPQEVNGVRMGHVLYVDRFGNLVTSFRSEEVPGIAHKSFEMKVGEAVSHQYRKVYSEAQEGELFVIGGSSGYLEVSLNQGDAAAHTRARLGETVTLRFIEN